jgi:hypothetical protein
MRPLPPEGRPLAGLLLVFAAAGFAVAVFLATRLIVGHLFPPRVRPWVWVPVAAVLTVLPFVDEFHNEQQTQLACQSDGGMSVIKKVSARTLDDGMALIDARRLDSEFPYYWRRELVFVYRPTGEELGHLRWFERKGGWLRGRRPGGGLFHEFRPAGCPDPQPFLVNGAARKLLVQAPPPG